MVQMFFFNPILIQVYPCKWGWPDLPHSNSNLSNSHSRSRLIQGILLLQTNTLALLLHLHLPQILWLSSLLLALHFKLQCFSQNMPITPPQHMPVPSYSIHRFVKDYSMNRGKLEFLEKNIIKNYGVRLRWQVQHDIQSPGLKSRPIKVGTKTHSNKITWRFFLSPKTWKP